jgi:hypothetical protein
LVITKQYKDREFNPADSFSMTPQELEIGLGNLKKCAQYVMRAMQPQAKQQAMAKMLPPQQQTAREGTNTVNLVEKQAAQQADVQARQTGKQIPIQRSSSSRDNKAPPPPTSDKPPFSFGAQSPPPDGVPQAYGPNGPTQDKLSIPSKKKRKGDNQSNTPVSTPVQLQTLGAAASPQMPRAEPVRTCSVGGCELSKKAFTTFEELRAHIDTAHKPKEPTVDNPLEWALEGVRLSLGLKEDGTTDPRTREKDLKVEKPASSLPMKISASAQGLTPGKMDLVGGTPMSRGQTGHTSNLGFPRSPQPGFVNVKTPGSDSKAPLLKLGQVAAPLPAAKRSSSPTADPWVDVSMSPAAISACFPSPADLEPYRSIILTPATTISSIGSEKNSPKSNIGENDLLNISLESENWLPQGWFDDVIDPNISALNMHDDLLSMDWETAFPPRPEEIKEAQPKSKGAKKDSCSFEFNIDLFRINDW